jgi:hypothetical protein
MDERASIVDGGSLFIPLDVIRMDATIPAWWDETTKETMNTVTAVTQTPWVEQDEKRFASPILGLGGASKTGRRVAERLAARGLPVRIGSRGERPFAWEDQRTRAPSAWATAAPGVRELTTRKAA